MLPDNLFEAVQVKLPTVSQLVALFNKALKGAAKDMREGDALEVRLQCTSSMWKLHTGDPGYDPDHKGHWGASQISPDDDDTSLREIAADMIEEVKDSVAQTDEAVQQIAEDPTLLLTAVEEGLIDASETEFAVTEAIRKVNVSMADLVAVNTAKDKSGHAKIDAASYKALRAKFYPRREFWLRQGAGTISGEAAAIKDQNILISTSAQMVTIKPAGPYFLVRREKNSDGTTSSEYYVMESVEESLNIRFNPGDRLQIRAHKSQPGKGLSYPSATVTVSDNGASGGWDVYDATTDDGEETSFYGFSVEKKLSKRKDESIDEAKANTLLFTDDSVDRAVARLKRMLKAPYVDVSKSSLVPKRPENLALVITMSADPVDPDYSPDKNKIFPRFGEYVLSANGKLEQTSTYSGGATLPTTVVRLLRDAADRLNKQFLDESDFAAAAVIECLSIHDEPVSLPVLRAAIDEESFEDAQILASISRLVTEGRVRYVRGEGYVLNEARDPLDDIPARPDISKYAARARGMEDALTSAIFNGTKLGDDFKSYVNRARAMLGAHGYSGFKCKPEALQAAFRTGGEIDCTFQGSKAEARSIARAMMNVMDAHEEGLDEGYVLNEARDPLDAFTKVADKPKDESVEEAKAGVEYDEKAMRKLALLDRYIAYACGDSLPNHLIPKESLHATFYAMVLGNPPMEKLYRKVLKQVQAESVKEDDDTESPGLIESPEMSKQMGIVNPNSSGQGEHPDHAKHPYHDTLDAPTNEAEGAQLDGARVTAKGVFAKGLKDGVTYTLQKAAQFGGEDTYVFVTASGKCAARFPESDIRRYLRNGQSGDNNGLVRESLDEAYIKRGSRVRLKAKYDDSGEGVIVKELGLKHNAMLGDTYHFMVKWDDVSKPQQVALEDIELV